MNTKLSLLLILICGITHAQSKIIYDYDSNGNRIRRKMCSECIIRKDPIIDATPINQDSLLLSAMGDEPGVSAENQVDELKKDIWKTWIGHQEIDIYPNPTQGYLSIGLKNFEDIKDCQVEVVDMNGHIVYNSTAKQRVYSMDLGNHPAGNYYINLRINGRLGSFVVIKQ